MTTLRSLGLLLSSVLLASSLGAQELVVRGAERGRAGEILRETAARPHRVISGAGPLELPRDSTVTGTIVVLGRDVFLASRVEGDVIVVRGNLFLRPGVAVSGRAVAIGGTVAETTLGTVKGGTESVRDESFDISAEGSGFVLAHRDERAGPAAVRLELAGLQGVLAPSYDRVNGLSLPVGGRFLATGIGLAVEPRVTYRSRLGAWDPAVAVRLVRGDSLRFEGRIGRDTRTNDAWIYSNLVNSATFFFAGADTRNYFRSDLAEGRGIMRIERGALVVQPFVGARAERVKPVSATGNVFTVLNRRDAEKGARTNPLVGPGTIGSVLAGAGMEFDATPITARARVELERSVAVPERSSQFTQITLDGRIEFPTFGTQSLAFRGHGVATSGGTVPSARYAYLGGSGTLPVLELLEQGGDQLLFVDGRYYIPFERIVLPFVGSPTLVLRDVIGAAGIGSLPRLEHQIGAGVGVKFLHLDFITDVRGDRGSRISFGVSLGS